MVNLRHLVIGIFFFTSLTLFAQDTEHFAFCKFEIADEAQMLEVQSHMRDLPFMEMVRLDHFNQMAYIVTRGLNELNENDVISWFESHSGSVSCVQIGVRGIDPYPSYPLQNCEE